MEGSCNCRGKWKNQRGEMGLEISPKFNSLFLFLSKIFLFSSIQNEYISGNLVLDRISLKIAGGGRRGSWNNNVPAEKKFE